MAGFNSEHWLPIMPVAQGVPLHVGLVKRLAVAVVAQLVPTGVVQPHVGQTGRGPIGLCPPCHTEGMPWGHAVFW
jgi:hypothetical protein